MKAASLDNLEFLLSPNRNNYLAVTFQKSPLLELIKSNYQKQNIFYLDWSKSSIPIEEYYADEEKIIQNTDFLDLAKKKCINWLKIDTHSSVNIEKIASNNNFWILSTKWELQEKLENKIYFDQILNNNGLPKPKSLIINTVKDYDKIDKYPIVIQIPNSDWWKWTFIIKNESELSEFKKRDIEMPLLWRDYIEWGLSIWVWAIIWKEDLIFTAIRMQIESNDLDLNYSRYLWIQWLKTSSISKTIIKKIENNLNKISKVFQEMWFLWIANFDLIIKDDDIYFIECNPRTGWSTPQLSLNPQLMHGLSFSEELIKSISWQKLSWNYPNIPESRYEWSNLDLDYFTNYFDKSKYRIEKPWVYQIWHKLSYVWSKIDHFKWGDKLFFYHYHQKDTKYSQDKFMWFMLFNCQLFKIWINWWILNKKWTQVYSSVKRFIKNRIINN